MKILIFCDYLLRAGIVLFLILDIAFKGAISHDVQREGMIFSS